MYQDLKQLEAEGRSIRVVVVGAAGSMGQGICLQTRLTPGLQLVGAVDINEDGLAKAVELAKGPVVYNSDLNQVINNVDFDVLVEATTTVEFAAKVCLAAFKKGAHVVLMNAEVDILLGPYLRQAAEDAGVVITSDAGDQHGVVSRMAKEIQMWGFDLVMLGNIKGFLRRHATYQEMIEPAKERHLNTVQCVSYTDGSKVNIEQALLANAFNGMPLRRGMIGPRCEDVREVFHLFNFGPETKWHADGCYVDYILGAAPGGGVFVVAHSNEPLQQQYLEYYKRGSGPFYLFYRPYHLCHLETPRAIASAFLYKKPIMVPQGKPTDVYTFAKTELAVGTEIREAIGSDHFYGMIDKRTECEELVPIALFESEAEVKATIIKPLKKDQPVTWDDVAIEETELLKLYRDQEVLLSGSKD